MAGQERRQLQGGFTLLELVIVMVIVGLAVGLVAPSLTRPMKRPKPDLVILLENARAHSIDTGRRVAVLTQGERVWLEPDDGSPPLRFDKDVYIEPQWPPASPYLPHHRLALFYADGTGLLSRFRLMRRRTGSADIELMSFEIDPLHGEVLYAYP